MHVYGHGHESWEIVFRLIWDDWSGPIVSLGFKQFEHIENGHFFVGESVYPSVNGDSGESVNTILLYQPTVAPTYSFPDPF